MNTLQKTGAGKHLDMTTGSIMSKVLLFAIPTVIGDRSRGIITMLSGMSDLEQMVDNLC